MLHNIQKNNIINVNISSNIIEKLFFIIYEIEPFNIVSLDKGNVS